MHPLLVPTPAWAATRRPMHPLLVTTLVLAATWDAWRWYVGRIAAAPEEAAALILTVIFLGTLGFVRARSAPPRAISLGHIAILLAAYAASYAMLPPIARAAIAIATTLFCLHLALLAARPPVAFWGLVALALPVLPSLQFTLGYPMRVVSATLSVALLQVQGVVVARQGTFLLWRDEMIQFDAPCSGVNMLWAGLLLTLMGCVVLRFDARKVAAAMALSAALAVVANALRASSLFYVETGLLPHGPAWWHEGTGLAAFAMSAGVTLWLLSRLKAKAVAA